MQFHPIGFIHSPYIDSGPRQSIPDAEGDFHIVIDPAFEKGLFRLEERAHIYVLYWLNRITEPVKWIITPHHNDANPVGLFASRTPLRPNPIGLALVELRNVEANILHISGIDALDGTPVLDIKPYFPGLDSPPLTSFNPKGDS
ncbi:MAG: tRNA (N6-threonylcarbamoyladenosine(37)-N6)-methyltransferase TrmO [Anaerolineaceae bacterium]|jgi:tRNA-Thr(GGU) m(6)t(6)A37 methyltransferase TsaA|nr:tRNA (N6-threonylcarbamoyladenosine(37)-N6)-methyltransferase TrmO [Anaerolineaceae bacterium]